MKEKLTMNNLRILNSLNSSGLVIRTPEASEVGELDSRYRLADWPYRASVKNKIKEKPYIRQAEYLDVVPLVGDYYRLICSNY